MIIITRSSESFILVIFGGSRSDIMVMLTWMLAVTEAKESFRGTSIKRASSRCFIMICSVYSFFNQ
ncbi:hypothetical protein HMPREF0201_02199 [Cedecea davisae DSM 4568]|uniref:Uncharacterized protein n=1 Tax=Cedecea davisae DSM 4568 TaxID=566551 RepID=S3JUY6_9ENTR|nr:hypothetical protein HMPREF0201_02199 [Cedecea davisae DSM 4568]